MFLFWNEGNNWLANFFLPFCMFVGFKANTLSVKLMCLFLCGIHWKLKAIHAKQFECLGDTMISTSKYLWNSNITFVHLFRHGQAVISSPYICIQYSAVNYNHNLKIAGGITGSHGIMKATPSMKVIVFWDVVPSCLVEAWWHFRGACCLCHQGTLMMGAVGKS
jgi:hypothetical protein